MSDFTAAISRPARPNVRTDCSWYPRAFFNAAQVHHGAMILTEKGKAAFRDFVTESVGLPVDPLERKKLEESIAEDVAFWAQMNEDLGDEGDDLLSGQDEVINGWATSGVIPPLREAIAELSIPGAAGLLAQCTEWAEKEFSASFERASEREELASFRLERWIKGANPFREHDWLPRAELWTAYETWCKFDNGGHEAGNPKDFYVALQELGFQPRVRRGTRGFSRPAS